MARHEYNSPDEDSQATKKEYLDLIDSIERRMDPDSNTVLLVDDERAIRRRVARDIKKTDSTIVIVEASNGKEALEKLAEIREDYKRDPILIVMDLNMPVMNGWDCIKALKKDYESRGEPHGIPVVVLSSTSGEKGMAIFKKSVHGGKSGYTPLVSVAKESCIDATKYDAKGEKGLMAWLKYFTKGTSY